MRRSVPLPRIDDSAAQALAGDVERRRSAERSTNPTGTTVKSVDGLLDIPVGGTQVITLYHRLGRTPVGWRITDQTCTGNVDGGFRRKSWNAKTIVLQNTCTNAMTIRLEVM